MSEYKKEPQNTVKRAANRGHYDKKTVYKILDAACVCHLGFVVDGKPFVIPTIYARDENKIYVHGSTKSRMLINMEKGIPVCLTVTHIDGLVLARSAFHHSMNYRSVMVFGNAKPVPEDEKNHALFMISENIIKDRWDEVRVPTEKELNITSILSIEIESASAKIREGDPSDDKGDYELDIWAGVIPLKTTTGKAIPDTKLKEGIEISESVKKYN